MRQDEREPVGTAVSVPAAASAGAARAARGSGKSTKATSGKLVANPEVETSGKSDLPLVKNNLPLTAEPDDGISFDDEIEQQQVGWRLEANSNGYYRWRWQLKDDNGEPVTYVNSSGNVGYKRGSKYVSIEEAKSRL